MSYNQLFLIMKLNKIQEIKTTEKPRCSNYEHASFYLNPRLFSFVRRGIMDKGFE